MSLCLALCILFISVYLGIYSMQNFEFYLNKIQNEIPDYIPIKQWRKMKYVNYSFIIIVICLGIILSINKL